MIGINQPYIRLELLLMIVAALIGLAACAAPALTPRPTPGPVPGRNVTIDLVAQNLTFNMSTITVLESASVKIDFKNKDDLVAHNLAVYRNLAGGQAEPIFVGDTITGPGATVYEFTAPMSSGSYFFECDVHPQYMNGAFVVTVP